MTTFHVYLTTNPGFLSVEADRVEHCGVGMRSGDYHPPHAYALVDTDGQPVLTVPADALVAIHRREATA